MKINRKHVLIGFWLAITTRVSRTLIFSSEFFKMMDLSFLYDFNSLVDRMVFLDLRNEMDDFSLIFRIILNYARINLLEIALKNFQKVASYFLKMKNRFRNCLCLMLGIFLEIFFENIKNLKLKHWAYYSHCKKVI